jgi:hypothetical protein
MFKIITYLLTITTISLASWGFLSYGTGQWYSEYVAAWEYRRLHPELIPDPTIVQLFDMWHTTSYASWLWLSLIQYIGDNVGGNRFLDFSHSILTQITTLHPYFTRPYEIDLILTPLSAWENMTAEYRSKNKIITNKAIELGKKWLATLCDQGKLDTIKKSEISETLWENAALKNPCASGMLPYYLGFSTHQMGEDKSLASEYYKIASMNDDAPQSSRILSILSLSAEWDYMASALTFALVGSTGYDVDPYVCHTLAKSLISDIIAKRKPNTAWINGLSRIERDLEDTRKADDPISNSSDNCYDMTTRSIKEIYLDYIATLANWTTAKNGEDLIKLGRIIKIPTLSFHDWYWVREKNGIWEYQAK